MSILSRRQFVERAAIAAGAVLCPSGIRASNSSRAPAELAAGLSERTSRARRRIATVARFLDEAYPQLRRETIAAADEALRGELLLPGHHGLSFVGDPPDWLTPRYGDEEYLWSLNRMAHWKSLLRAHALTGEERYAAKVVDELDDWIARAGAPRFLHHDGTPNPQAVSNAGPPPWRSLEIGIRMFDTWPVVIEHLAGTAHLPPARLARAAESVAQHAEALSLLTPLLWPDADHNHYFMEMLGLLSIGVIYPELSGATSWTNQATRELQRCVRHQFTTDGGHVEGCPSYHNLCVVFLVRFLSLAAAAHRKLPADIHQIATASIEQTLHSTRPTGTVVPWGDSTQPENFVEAAVWFYKVSNDVSVLQHLAALTGLEKLQSLCAPFLWEIDEPADLFARMAAPPTPRARVRFDRGNDQVMARSAWQRDAVSVFFACHSPLWPGSGHQHVDLGGFDFTAYGKPLVVDPGPFTYRESEDRRTFKSAAWHSVLTVDEREPFDYVNRWRYTPQKEGRISALHVEPGIVRIDSFHHNYEPVLCRRTLALLDDRLLVVLDMIENLPATSAVQIYFHVDSLTLAWDATQRTATTHDTASPGLVIAASAGLACDLLPGRISEKFDTARPSTRLRFSDTGGDAHRVYAHVLAPFRSGERVPSIEKIAIAGDASHCTFVCEGRDYRVACPPTPR